MNWAAWLLPPGPVTVTATLPEPPGAVAAIRVGESTVKPAAGEPPNWTPVMPEKFDPEICTEVPAAPDVGLMPVRVGAPGGGGGCCDGGGGLGGMGEGPPTPTTVGWVGWLGAEGLALGGVTSTPCLEGAPEVEPFPWGK